ncbi:MAG: adenylate/guanylate cyclase domain-containing protein [Acetobacteraceae bacterium]|jgi:class 3 adenylate cyclase
MSVTGAAHSTERPLNRRKLIAVIHADMVGYSRLIGLDDIGTIERLHTLRGEVIDPAINAYGGVIVQTGGDSLLIVFDSIEGAVRCAVQVQTQVRIRDGDVPRDRAIRFRMGINIGDVIADGADLHGDAVNVAARLQAECPPGGICVTRPVRDHVRDRLDLAFDELGALELKNIARRVEAFVLRLEPEIAGMPKASSNQQLRSMPTGPRPSVTATILGQAVPSVRPTPEEAVVALRRIVRAWELDRFDATALIGVSGGDIAAIAWKEDLLLRVAYLIELEQAILKLDPKGGIPRWVTTRKPGPFFADTSPLQMMTGSTRKMAELLEQVEQWSAGRR